MPSNVAKSVMSEILKNGKVERGYVGITFAPLQDMEQFFDIDMNKGVLVQNVDALSPAAVAGLVAGDIVLQIDGEKIDGRFPEQLPNIMHKIADAKEAGKIEMEISAAAKKFPRLCRRAPESRIGRNNLRKWGVGMRDITKAYARESKIETDSRLMVIGLRNGFPFSNAEIEKGDIIISVNRKKVSNEAELRAAYEQYCKDPKKTLVEVMRDRTLSFHIIPAEK